MWTGRLVETPNRTVSTYLEGDRTVQELPNIDKVQKGEEFKRVHKSFKVWEGSVSKCSVK